MTTAMFDQDQKLLDVEREAVIRLMRHCHDLRDRAIRDGDKHEPFIGTVPSTSAASSLKWRASGG